MRMTIFVTTPAGMTMPVNHVKKSDRVESVKEEVECFNGVEMHLQRLIYEGQVLEDDKTLGEYGIGRNSTLVLEYTQDGVLERKWGWRYCHSLRQLSLKPTPPKPNGTLPVKATNNGKKNIVRGKTYA